MCLLKLLSVDKRVLLLLLKSTMVSLTLTFTLILGIIFATGVCSYPFKEENNGSSSVIAILGSTNPVLVGMSIMLHCLPEKTLIGPENITCMENGEWEPNPGNAVCNDSKLLLHAYKTFHE